MTEIEARAKGIAPLLGVVTREIIRLAGNDVDDLNDVAGDIVVRAGIR